MSSSLQPKLRGRGRREACREREEEPPCPGRRVISGEMSLGTWACLKEKREESEEEFVETCDRHKKKFVIGKEIRRTASLMKG